MKVIPGIGVRQAEILEYLEEHGESTLQDIAEVSDANEDRLRDSIRILEKRGIVESRPNPRNAQQKLRKLSGEWDE